MFAASKAFFGEKVEEVDTAAVFLLAASGPTTIYDASPNNLTVSRFGSATATTAETNFSGKYSIYLDGVDSYLRLPNDSVFDLGTGDFTIEQWVYPLGTSGTQHFGVAAGNGTTDWVFVRSNSTSVQLFLETSYVMGATALEANVWQHYAFSRSGSDVRLFKNGVQLGSTATSTANIAIDAYEPVIGGLTAGTGLFNGYIQDLRISNTARYTGTFTPPGSLT